MNSAQFPVFSGIKLILRLVPLDQEFSLFKILVL